MLRRQLPVYSPVSWRAILSGAGATVGGGSRGERRARFEDRLRARYGALDVLLTDSGTSALRLAIEGAVAQSGRPVALPGYACYDLATAAEGADARVALYDVDPSTLGPELASLASLRPLRPAAVVVAHWFGHLVDVPAAGAVHPDAVLIEDAAQGAGGSLQGRPLGSFGSVAVLSFGRGKGTTGGGGGALLAHDDRGKAIVAQARTRLGGRRRGIAQIAALTAQHILGRPALYGIPSALPFLHLGETVYHPPRPPRRDSAPTVAVLDAVWAEADREVDVRKRHAARLRVALEGSPRLRPVASVPGGEPGCLRLPAVAREGRHSAVLGPRTARMGVEKGYPTTLAVLPSLAARLTIGEAQLPGSARLAEALVTLPTHRWLTERDLTSLEEWLSAR